MTEHKNITPPERRQVEGLTDPDKLKQQVEQRNQLLEVVAMEAVAASKRARDAGRQPKDIESSGERVMVGLGNVLSSEDEKDGIKKEGNRGQDAYYEKSDGTRIYPTIHLVDGVYVPIPPKSKVVDLQSGEYAITTFLGRSGDFYTVRLQDAAGKQTDQTFTRADIVEISLVTRQADISHAVSTDKPTTEEAPVAFPPKSAFATEQGIQLLTDISKAIATSHENPDQLDITSGHQSGIQDRIKAVKEHFPLVKGIVPTELKNAKVLAEEAMKKSTDLSSERQEIAAKIKTANGAVEAATKTLRENDQKTKENLDAAEKELQELLKRNGELEAVSKASAEAQKKVTDLEKKYVDLMNDPPTAEALNGYFHEHLKTDLPAHLSLLEAERQKLITLLEREKASLVSRPQEVDRLTNEVAHVDKLVAKLHSIQKDPNISNGFFVSLQRGEQAPEVVSAMKEAFSTGKISEALSESLADKLISDILPKDVTPEQKKEMSKAVSILLKTGGFLLVGIICMLVDAGTEGKSNFATVIASLMNSGRFGDLSYNDQQALRMMKEARELGKSVKIGHDGKAQIVN
ncbi:MAG: hypothetical protein WCJ70_04090 [bacterium]